MNFRELIISIYLLCFKWLFELCKMFPLKRKVTFLVSFPENTMAMYQEMKRQKLDLQCVFLCHKRTLNAFNNLGEPTYLLESKNLIHTFVGIYHMATSTHVVADNYYGFLAVTTFKKSVRCIQIWHAVGAIKKFGAHDPTNVDRSPSARARFAAVYNRFDQFVIGADFMGDIFKEAFLAEDKTFLKTGVPRTDFFFDVDKHKDIIATFHTSNPLFKEKKVILYAPTFRKNEEKNRINLDFKKLYEQLSDDFVFVIKCHPSVKISIDITGEYEDFIFDYSDYSDIAHLLVVSDLLITDYSSIPMEFATLKRPMIFYAYDLDDYQADHGLWEHYETSVPGPVVKNTDELIDGILQHDYPLELIDLYVKKWAEYCDGYASERLIHALFQTA